MAFAMDKRELYCRCDHEFLNIFVGGAASSACHPPPETQMSYNSSFTCVSQVLSNVYTVPGSINYPIMSFDQSKKLVKEAYDQKKELVFVTEIV